MGQLAQIGASFMLPKAGISPVFGETMASSQFSKNGSVRAGGIAVEPQSEASSVGGLTVGKETSSGLNGKDVPAGVSPIQSGNSSDTTPGLKNSSGTSDSSTNSARDQYYEGGSGAAPSPGGNASGSSGGNIKWPSGSVENKEEPLLEKNLADPKVKWVDENAGMSQEARDYNDSATGARSNPVTQSEQAPALERTMPDGSTRLVKFDGVDGDVLIDRKVSVVTTDKAKEQALRQSDVLRQNGFTGRWEVPSDAQAARATKMFNELGITNIQVNVVKK